MRLIPCLAALPLIAVLAATTAHAGTYSYSGYSVLNQQNVTITDTALGINEYAGSGQITLNGTPALSVWCVDIQDDLTGSGTFGTGTTVTGQFGTRLNALLSNVPGLSSGTYVSSAIQIAIWTLEYGSAVNIATGNADLTNLANSYVLNVQNGTWVANAADQVNFLDGAGSNQNQAYLVPAGPVQVPEPMSIALLGTALVGLGVAARRRA